MTEAAELVRVLRFHVKLLYSARVASEFAANPAGTLGQWGLGEYWRDVLPDPSSPGFAAEVHGRRIMAANDLLATYGATLRHLDCAGAGDILNRPWFVSYLDSPEFFEERFSLADTTGVGRGYEGYSRFFFWARTHLKPVDPRARLALRDDLFLDFAAAVDARKRGALDPTWDVLQSGFFWSVQPATDFPCRGLSADRKVVTDGQPGARGRMLGAGLIDLDSLYP